MTLNITGPSGRLVQGDAFEPQTTDQQGAPLVVKSGPNAGQPRKEWFIAVAYSKQDPAWPAYYSAIVAEAAAAWPTMFPHGARPDMPNGGCTNPAFAWKIIDGDGYDTTGKHNATKEGFAGCWVVRYSSGYGPKVFPAGRYAPHEQIFDRNLLRRGYYVRVNASITSNMNAQKPGLYTNFGLVEIAGYGPEIVSGPDPTQAFATPATLPPGASATPLAGPGPGPTNPAAGAPPATPAYGSPGGMPAAGAPSPSVNGPGAPTPAYPSNPPAPAYTGYMPGAPPPAPAAPAAAPPPPPPAPPAAPVRVMTAAAGALTYLDYVNAGWNDAQMIAAGLLLP